jgi:lipopolysaccharide export system permease protein
MDSGELKSQIDFLSKGGLSTRRLRVDYFMKQSIPASCLVFALIGIAYCLGFVRSGKDWWGVIVAVCVSVLTVGFFFFLIALFRSLGFKGILDPFWAAWLPDILYGGLASVAIAYQAFFR